MVFREDPPGIDENPLRGLVPYSSARQPDNFPHSMEWFYLPLSAIVINRNTYNWQALESQLIAIAERGHQAVFRFYLDYPGKPSGIPHYLLRAGLKTYSYDDFNNAAGSTRSVAPDYKDPLLIDCLVRFIQAFGTKYDGDLRIAYVTAGLYGFWGEWHVADHPHRGEAAGWLMAQKDKDALLCAFRDSFQKTFVLVRYPYVTGNRALLANFGFHDDSLLNDTVGPEDWQFWHSMQNAELTDSWKFRPTGGEIYPPLQTGLWGSWPNHAGQSVKDVISTAHVTWILDNKLFEGPSTELERTNALRVQRMLGYKLYCSAGRLALLPDGSASISARIENRGVAPFYASWLVELAALDSAGNVVEQGHAAWPLAKLLPGETTELNARLEALPKGAKAIVLRIANPLPKGHAVVFANAEMGTLIGGWLTLGAFDMPSADVPPPQGR
jgi:uncharacterized protein DUF4832